MKLSTKILDSIQRGESSKARPWEVEAMFSERRARPGDVKTITVFAQDIRAFLNEIVVSPVRPT